MAWWDDFADDFASGADDVGDYGNILDDFASGADDVGNYFVDTVTGEVVSADDIAGMGYQDVGDMGPVGEVYGPDDMYGPQNYDWEAASEGETGPGQATPGQIAATSPYNAGGGMDWLKALGQGLKAATGLLGGGSGQGGLAGLTQDARGGGAAISGLPGLMSAGIPQVGGVGAPDITRVGAWSRPDIASAGGMSQPDIASAGGMSQPDIARLGGMSQADILGGARMQDAIHAAYAQGQADPGMRLGLQGPIDAGPIRDQFAPLVMPFAPIGGGMPPAQRLSGLQRLAAERFG